MLVTIQTEKGSMKLDLEEFFPTTQDRVRKLFRVMRGMPENKKAEVRDYLEYKKQESGKIKAGVQKEVSREREKQEEMELLCETLKQRIAESRNRESALREKARIAAWVEKSAPMWLKLFDDICGGR